MTEAQKILQMIEGVDPNDSNDVNDIEVRFWRWYTGVKEIEFFCEDPDGMVGWVDEEDYFIDVSNAPEKFYLAKVATSRDALKAIRPKGWSMAMHQHCSNAFGCFLENNFYRTDIYDIATEELAELHAIIQAHEWERSQ